MPAVTRDWTITYGSQTVGGTSENILEYPVTIDEDYEVFTVTFPFVMTAASGTDFNTQCAALEDAFNKPDQSFTMANESGNFFSADPSSNSGFNTRASITKGESDADTGRSRRYEVTITGMRPADLSGRSGRQSSQVVVDYLPSRIRTLTITGVYTALSSNTATEQYEAAIGAYATAVQSALTTSGTWELITENTDADDQDKILNFSRTYRDLTNFNQTTTLDDAEIVQDVIRVRRSRIRPGDTPGRNPKRLLEITVTYDAWLDATSTTDLVGKWENTIRPYLTGTVVPLVASGVSAVVDSSPEFDYRDNRITATMTILTKEGSNLIQFEKTTDYDTEFGMNIRGVHNGDPFAAYEWQGPGQRLITITYNFEAFGTIPASLLEARGIDAIPGGGAGRKNVRGNQGGGGGEGFGDPPNPNASDNAKARARGGPGNKGGKGARLLNRKAQATTLLVGDDSDNFIKTVGVLVETYQWFRGFNRKGGPGTVESRR
jgi:hypothetical protein